MSNNKQQANTILSGISFNVTDGNTLELSEDFARAVRAVVENMFKDYPEKLESFVNGVVKNLQPVLDDCLKIEMDKIAAIELNSLGEPQIFIESGDRIDIRDITLTSRLCVGDWLARKSGDEEWTAVPDDIDAVEEEDIDAECLEDDDDFDDTPDCENCEHFDECFPDEDWTDEDQESLDQLNEEFLDEEEDYEDEDEDDCECDCLQCRKERGE